MTDAGEVLFERYLRQRVELTAEYEARVSGRRPDFQVVGPTAQAVCEVYSPQVLLSPGGGPFDSFGPLRGAFKSRKRGQGEDAKATGTPYVVVVSAANSPVGFGAFELMVGMFGGPRRIHSGQNTRFSALAVVSAFNPTAWRIEKSIAAADGGTEHSLEEAIAQSLCTMEELEARGVYERTAEAVRLDIVHNPWAANPLPLELFGGAWDRQYRFDTTTPTGELLAIWEGDRVHELPSSVL